MWLWDGTDRREDDVEAAMVEMVRRAMMSTDPSVIADMQSYIGPIALAMTGRVSGALVAPEPVIQGGFTPTDDERALMCEDVKKSGRDLVHICFRSTGGVTPTGLIVVVYHDGDRVRLHSRCSIFWSQKSNNLQLWGVEDISDQFCHFEFNAGRKLRWVKDHKMQAQPLMKEAEARTLEIRQNSARSLFLNEPVEFYHHRQPIWARAL